MWPEYERYVALRRMATQSKLESGRLSTRDLLGAARLASATSSTDDRLPEHSADGPLTPPPTSPSILKSASADTSACAPVASPVLVHPSPPQPSTEPSMHTAPPEGMPVTSAPSTSYSKPGGPSPRKVLFRDDSWKSSDGTEPPIQPHVSTLPAISAEEIAELPKQHLREEAPSTAAGAATPTSGTRLDAWKLARATSSKVEPPDDATKLRQERITILRSAEALSHEGSPPPPSPPPPQRDDRAALKWLSDREMRLARADEAMAI